MTASKKFYITALIAGLLASSATQSLGQMSLDGIDNSSPINIVSDTLTFIREENIAIFKGNVEAVQNNFTLKSDVMKALYHAKDPKNTGKSGLKRIDVEGNVVLRNPTKTARSNQGTYLVDDKKITLEGNVVLEEGPQIIKGNKFVYDVASGKSEIFSKQASGVASSKDEKPGRVRAVIIPEAKPTQKPQAKTKAPASTPKTKPKN